MIVNGNSSLVSMKTRCSRATRLLPEGGADRVASGAALVTFGGDVNGVLDPDAAVAATGQAAESSPREVELADICDIMLSSDHHDHVGGLAEVVQLAPHAVVWGSAPLSARALPDGVLVRDLRVIATPGHAAAHISLLHATDVLLVGDLVRWS